jgi:hypothetical protein
MNRWSRWFAEDGEVATRSRYRCTPRPLDSPDEAIFDAVQVRLPRVSQTAPGTGLAAVNADTTSAVSPEFTG